MTSAAKGSLENASRNGLERPEDRAAPVALEGVTKRFGGDVLAVDALDLEITPDQFVAAMAATG